MTNLRRHLNVKVTQEHIDKAKCLDPNRCMIKLAIIEAVGKNCYCKVDMTGISITRRDDYREKAFLPRKAALALIKFDAKKPVQPFEFNVEFVKSTPVYQYDEKKLIKVRAHKRRLKAEGKLKRYGPATRTTAGVAVDSKQVASIAS